MAPRRGALSLISRKNDEEIIVDCWRQMEDDRVVIVVTIREENATFLSPFSMRALQDMTRKIGEFYFKQTIVGTKVLQTQK